MGIKGFIETSFLDWRGKVCAVLFLPGCNLRCPFCHNPELVLHPERLADIPWEFIEKRLQSLGKWLDGVCVTGGEPTLSGQLPDLLAALRRLGLAVKLDTNGTRPEVLADLTARGLVDYVAMDVKGPLEDGLYSRWVGAPVSVADLRRSIELISTGRVAGEFRTTVIPGWHGSEVLDRIRQSLGTRCRWVLQEFRDGNLLEPSFLRSAGRGTPDLLH